MSDRDQKPIRFDDRGAFRAWVCRQPGGRWEREAGLVIAMASERAVHARIKVWVWVVLNRSIREAGLPCEVFTDGMPVEVDARTDYEPDAVVTCGKRVEDGSVAVDDPVVIVEVLSPSTGYRDVSSKLDGYFSLPSVRHYLLFSSDACRVVHHRRSGAGPLMTTIHHGGVIELDPPGLRLPVAECYTDTDLAARTG